MKPTPYRFLLLLCCLISAYTLRAQDTSKIPSLKVWYEIPNVWNASYLEKFDTANGGNGALVLNRSWGEGQTIYMQGRGDTTNRFTWERWGGMGGGQYVETVDFNGDGVNDYLQGDGIIYRGKTKNAPPESIPVARYDITFYGIGRRCVADFNDDGKEDFLSGIVSGNTLGEAPGPFIGRIILGNSDLTKMKVIEMPQIQGTYPGAYSIQNIVSAWRENGKNYMVVYNYTPDGYKPRSDAFELCEFVIVADTTISYTTLDHVPYKAWPDPNTPYYSYSSSFVWHSKDGKEHTIVCDINVNRSCDIYRIVNGKLVFQWTTTRPQGSSDLLSYGVTNMKSNGYARGYNPFIYVYEDNPADDSIAKAKIPLFYKNNSFEIISSCGDVNADGFGDLAVVYTGIDGPSLLIYLGTNMSAGVSNDAQPGLSFSIDSQQPFKTGQPLNITIDAKKPATYTANLYSVRGELVKTLFSRYLDFGLHSISSTIENVPCGLYNIHLIGNGVSVDKAILIIP
ncbi:MAG: hypothetical protein ACK45R_06540 [Candidatus Kapaibacterium sp.]